MDDRNEFLAKPPWRGRASPRRKAVALSSTFGAIIILGFALLWLLFVVLDKLTSAGWVIPVTWVALTALTALWAMRSKPADPTDYDGQSWVEYVIRFVMVGEQQVRPAPQRVMTAVIFGAPLVLAWIVSFLFELAGIA